MHTPWHGYKPCRRRTRRTRTRAGPIWTTNPVAKDCSCYVGAVSPPPCMREHVRSRQEAISVPGFYLYGDRNSGWSEDDAVTLGSTAVCRPARHRRSAGRQPHQSTRFQRHGTATAPPLPICERVEKIDYTRLRRRPQRLDARTAGGGGLIRLCFASGSASAGPPLLRHLCL